MLTVKDQLVESERLLGQYTAVILRYHASGKWGSSMIQLDAVVTNYRLLLRPHRKRYRPAALPARYVTQVELTRKGMYRCAMLSLTSGDVLCLSIQTGSLDDFHDDLRAMKIPPPKFRFDDKVARDDIERLITFFGREPLPDKTTS